MQPTGDEHSMEEIASLLLKLKLTTTAQISVDGVMQGPGGPEEDERGRFERGGWAHFDDEASTVMDLIYQRAEVFLLGRRTYEVFAGSWGTWSDPGDSPIWTALNTKRKYVALSLTALSDPRWANTTVPSGHFTAAVRELKARPGGELQVHGSGALFSWLLQNELVDEIFYKPVHLPRGRRPGHAAAPAHRAEHTARTDRIAGHAQRRDDPHLPAHWASAVCGLTSARLRGVQG
jgi:dihydrofolate reductase